MSRHADYETDILEWSERQASVLRDLARNGRGLPNELDLENVAEEIESVGRSEFAAVQSYCRQILIHLVTALSVPDSAALLHWRKEGAGFQQDLLDRISPSMRSRLDLDHLWRQALRQAGLDLAVDDQALAPDLPPDCPLTIADIVDPEFDLLRAAETVRRQMPRSG